MVNLGQVFERLGSNEISKDPWNVLDIRNRFPNVLPMLLEHDNFRLLHDVTEGGLASKWAQRDSASTGEARRHKDLLEGGLIAEAGSHTGFHIDAHGFDT